MDKRTFKKALLIATKGCAIQHNGWCCECGNALPKGESYCEACQDMYQDRLETERRIEAEEIRMEGER